jgi:hypothetical protein
MSIPIPCLKPNPLAQDYVSLTGALNHALSLEVAPSIEWVHACAHTRELARHKLQLRLRINTSAAATTVDRPGFPDPPHPHHHPYSCDGEPEFHAATGVYFANVLDESPSAQSEALRHFQSWKTVRPRVCDTDAGPHHASHPEFSTSTPVSPTRSTWTEDLPTGARRGAWPPQPRRGYFHM